MVAIKPPIFAIDREYYANFCTGKFATARIWPSVLESDPQFRQERVGRGYTPGALGLRQAVQEGLESGIYEGDAFESAREGIPYQTLMASVLHKYVHGTLAER